MLEAFGRFVYIIYIGWCWPLIIIDDVPTHRQDVWCVWAWWQCQMWLCDLMWMCYWMRFDQWTIHSLLECRRGKQWFNDIQRIAVGHATANYACLLKRKMITERHEKDLAKMKQKKNNNNLIWRIYRWLLYMFGHQQALTFAQRLKKSHKLNYWNNYHMDFLSIVRILPIINIAKI